MGHTHNCVAGVIDFTTPPPVLQAHEVDIVLFIFASGAVCSVLIESRSSAKEHGLIVPSKRKPSSFRTTVILSQRILLNWSITSSGILGEAGHQGSLPFYKPFSSIVNQNIVEQTSNRLHEAFALQKLKKRCGVAERHSGYPICVMEQPQTQVLNRLGPMLFNYSSTVACTTGVCKLRE
eukprot:6365485-Amphidinium_carterae.1